MCSQFSPDVILLQETWLSSNQKFGLYNYRTFRLDRPTRGGGLLSLISTKFAHTAKVSFQLQRPDCEILVLELKLPGCLPFSLANVYFPSGVVDSEPLDLAIASAVPPIIFAGDFNSHHVTWGFRTDSCGNRLLDWITDNNLTCINSDSPTYHKGQTQSVLDLTIFSRFIFSRCFSAFLVDR